jgi:Bacterial Ig-like domain (group 3)
MKLPSASEIIFACLLVVGSVGIANCQSWTPLTNPAPVSMGTMLLLTDGRVLVHEEPNCTPGSSGCVGSSYSTWYTLTPDHTGSYINGTWTKVASLPTGYAPLFFGSAVLPDGKVVIQGGEYNCPGGSCSAVWQSLGALYDPAANTWNSTTPPIPTSWRALGDAQSIVLPNGTWMLAACCAKIAGRSTFPLYFYFNESTLNFTTEANSTDGKFDDFDEEGWILLPNGNVLTVDAYTTNTNFKGTNSELYNPSTNKWATAGSTTVQLWDSNCRVGGGSYEVGPGVLMPNGTVFYTGASDCAPGNIATYDLGTATWTAQSPFPNNDAANDAPASIEPNGNVIVMASPFSGTFSAPSTFYEWNGTSLSTFPNPANAVNDPSFVGHLLALPSGEILFTDYSTGVEVLTTAGTYQTAWQPTITTAPVNVSPGKTYSISGTQFNGLSQGAAYGDDFQDATNYPLVRIVNTATGNVFYAKTHGHSTMGVATGTTLVSTNFDVPAGMPTGPCELYVVANGIPSAAKACAVGFATTTALGSSPNPSTVGQPVTFTATVSSSSGTPAGKVTFRDGTATLGTVTLTSGVATFTTSSLTAGKHKITARYNGSSKFAPSSASLIQTVN